MMKKILIIMMAFSLWSCGDGEEPSENNSLDTIDEEMPEELEEVSSEPQIDPNKVYWVYDFLDEVMELEDKEVWNGQWVKVKLVVMTGNSKTSTKYNDSLTTSVNISIPAKYYGKDSAYKAERELEWDGVTFDPRWFAEGNENMIFEKGDTIVVRALWEHHWAKGPQFDRLFLIEE